MRLDLHRLPTTGVARGVTRVLIFLLLTQNFPLDALQPRSAAAQAARPLLWVDGSGSCTGKSPCYTTIQAAIDAVGSGQTVRVLPGEYREKLLVKHKNAGGSVTATDRITIEADPESPAGSVVLRGRNDRCEGGYGIDFVRSKRVTLRGFTLSGAGPRGIVLRGGAGQNEGIRLERNRLFRGGTRECSGGIDVGRGNPDTVIANNLIYANGRHGIRFRDGRGGSYVVVGNTILRNGWSGIYITHGAQALIANNIIAFNGTAPGRSGGGRHGILRQRSGSPKPEGVELDSNLICGNRLGELAGPLLDDSDRDNQTPTGSEGPGVVASPTCALPASVFQHLAGEDGSLDTADDDFTLAAGSPALDRGRDPRGQSANVPDEVFEADYFAADARPRDGDGDRVAQFDIGAVEKGGEVTPSPTPTGGSTATPTPSATAPATPTPTPVVTSSPAATPTRTPQTSTTPAPTPTLVVVPPTPPSTPTPSPAATPTRTPGPTAANRDPVAVDDEYAVRVGEALNVPARGVLDNDHDPDGNALTVQLVDAPLLGTLTTFDPDGSFAYQAPANFVQPGLNPTVAARYAIALSTFGNVADFNRDGFPDLLTLEFGSIRVFDGRNGTVLSDVNLSDTTAVDVTGCNTYAANSTVAVGDIDDSGDVSVVSPLTCPDGIDRFVGINGSQITAGKVHASWVTERLTKPHPDSYVGPNATEPADPPIRPYLAFGAAGFTEPTLARLEAGGGVKLLARNLLGNYEGYYYTKNDQGVVELRYAECRAVTGLPADEGKLCRVTWIINAANGAVEEVLTAPNPSAEIDTYTRRPLRENAPIVADLDGDGEVEIISGSDVFKRVGGVWTLAWQTQYEPVSVAVADLDGDGTSEVIQDQHRYANGKTDADTGIFIYAHDGTLIRRIPVVVPGAAAQGFLSIADADGDGQPDILYVADGILSVYRADGRLLWLVVLPDRPEPLGVFIPPAAGLQGRSGETAPQVYDLDNDGHPEVILNAAARLFIFDGRTGAEKYSIDTEGYSGYGAKTLALADVDNDGHVDIVAMGYDRWNCSVLTGGPVDCKGSTLIVSGADHNWAPGPKIFNQINFRPDAVNDAAKILFAPAARRDFRRAEQQGTVVDPRLRAGATFTYQASDGAASSNTATVFVKINPDNSPPVITSLPPTGLISEAPYPRPIYQITATDPDPGDTLHYELVSTTHPFGAAPPFGTGFGVNLNPTTGAVDFYVGPCGSYGFGCALGDVAVVVAAIDSLGLRAEQSFVVTIGVDKTTVPNVVGELLQAAIDTLQAASLRARVVLEIFAAQPAGTVIAQTPEGGTADVAFGTSVDLTLSKGSAPTPTPTPSRTPDPNATPTPVPTAGPPLASIVVEPLNQLLLVGNTQAYLATAVFSDGTSADITSSVTWTSSVPATASITASGLASALAPGTTTITATSGAVSGTVSLGVAAVVAGDDTPPLAAIDSPAANSEVIAPSDIVGIATDANFLKYEVDLAPAGETTFTRIATGVSQVASGVLGVLDPTLLLNGPYTVRLRVYDAGGNVAEVTRVYVIAGERKVGNFTLAFTDLAIGLSGIPITITRSYDSRDKGKGDFGIGWRLDVQTLRLRTNRVLGTGWTTQNAGISVQLVALDQHYVTVTLPDGTVETFDLQLSPTSNAFSLDFTNVVGFVPRPGTLGTLEGLDNPSLLVVPGGTEVELWDDSTLDTYNPRKFRYTTADGQQIVIDRVNGVESTTDPNGNALTFGPFGITHSSGKSVAFTRDAQGRITQLTDPNGSIQTYAYDAAGNLVRHTNAVGNVTGFTYNRSHGLLDIFDPSGARVARNEYDDSGRLVATIDAEGRRVELTHDLNARQEVVKDRLGNVTVFEYDAVGNVVAKTDALGGRTTYTSDAVGNQLTETDPLGRVATKTYDGRRQVLSSTDFDGNTTTTSYNARGQVLSTTDPDGRTTINVYDANGNLTQTTDPEGGVTQHVNDAAGNQTSTTDPLGKLTSFTYDAFGDKTSETDPLGTVASFSYDANGDPLSSTKAGRTTQIEYDGARHPTKTTDALGQHTIMTYSVIGDGKKLASVSDPSGRITRHDYDVHGRRTQTTFPDGSTSELSYDAEGRVLGQKNRDGNTSTFQYDALGRQTVTVHPDGTTVVKTFDAAGRVITHADERGNVTTYAYAPNKQIVTDPLGKVTTHELDHLQRRVKTTDALGHSTSFAYDSRGNLTRTTFPDGSEKTTTYDLAGRKTMETDQAGRTATFTYDALGRLTQVTDAAGQMTVYAYDALGNLTEQTDADGRVTSATYDVLGRVVGRTRPLGQVESFVFDTNGNQISHTDFDGETTTVAYDSSDRLVARTLPDASVVSFAYTAEGKRTQAGGDSYAYDSRGRLTQETKASGEVLSYTYDAAGNRTSMTTPQGTTTYTYDALNRLSTVADTTGTTGYTYDAVGNAASTSYPNDVVTDYAYDSLNRLVQLTNTGPSGLISSYTYTLGAAGNRLQVAEAGPVTTGRMVFYSYDAVYRLTEELIDEPGTANDRAILYDYDAVGNRTAMNRNGVLTTYDYDANDRLTDETTGAVTTTYTYDGKGSMLSRSAGGTADVYTYDAENRLIAAGVQSGSNPGAVSYTYDADGMRTSRLANGQTTSFLLDKNREHAQVVAETTGGATVVYAYGHDLLSQTRPGEDSSFYQYDGQLSTRQLTNASGAVSDAYTYDAFGVMLASSGTTTNAYLYGGEQLDPNVGFYYLRARYYDQATGRFTSTDPEEGSIFDPASLHRYLYAGADPVNNADPSGRFEGGLSGGLATLGLANILLVGVVFILGLVAQKTATESALIAGHLLFDIIVIEIAFSIGGVIVAVASGGAVTIGAGALAATGEGTAALGLIKVIQEVGGSAKAIELLTSINRGLQVAKASRPLAAALKGSLEVFRENKAILCAAKSFAETVGKGGFPIYISGHFVTPGEAKGVAKALELMGEVAGVTC